MQTHRAVTRGAFRRLALQMWRLKTTRGDASRDDAANQWKHRKPREASADETKLSETFWNFLKLPEDQTPGNVLCPTDFCLQIVTSFNVTSSTWNFLFEARQNFYFERFSSFISSRWQQEVLPHTLDNDHRRRNFKIHFDVKPEHGTRWHHKVSLCRVFHIQDQRYANVTRKH